MEETRNDRNTLQIVEFREKYRSKVCNRECIDCDNLLCEFNRLTDDEKEALILSVIRDDNFDIKEHPDLYNEHVLIESKHRFITVIFIVFLSLYFTILYSLVDSNSTLSRILSSINSFSSFGEYITISFPFNNGVYILVTVKSKAKDEYNGNASFSSSIYIFLAHIT